MWAALCYIWISYQKSCSPIHISYTLIPALLFPTRLSARGSVEDSAYQREKKINIRQVMFASWLQNMTSVAKTPDKHKYWWEGNYLQLKCDWGTRKTSKLVLPLALWYKNPQYSEGDSKTRKDKSQAEEILKELYQFPQIISVLTVIC